MKVIQISVPDQIVVVAHNDFVMGFKRLPHKMVKVFTKFDEKSHYIASSVYNKCVQTGATALVAAEKKYGPDYKAKAKPSQKALRALNIAVVKYNGNYYLWWGVNSANKARLIAANGKKFSGTPSCGKLRIVKRLPVKEYNKRQYVLTKQGVFSLATGNKIVAQNIIKALS